MKLYQIYIYLANRRQQQQQQKKTPQLLAFINIPKVENYESNEIKITIRPISSNYLKNYENDYFHYKK